MSKTRKKHAIIGPSLEYFPQSQLPTWGQVFARILHVKERNSRNQNTTNVVSEVVTELYDLWKKANIPALKEQNARKRITKAFNRYQAVTKKNIKRGEAQNKQISDVQKMCLELCDVAAADAVQQIQNNRLLSTKDKECDIAFYLDQKGARMGGMASRDTKYQGKVACKRQREEAEEKRRKRAAGETGPTDDRAMAEDMNETRDDIDEGKTDDDSEEYTQPDGNTRKPDKVTLTFPRNILKSPKICKMADRLRLSSNQVCQSFTNFLRD